MTRFRNSSSLLVVEKKQYLRENNLEMVNQTHKLQLPVLVRSVLQYLLNGHCLPSFQAFSLKDDAK